MAVLVKLALLITLGILQASSQGIKDIAAVQTQTYEVQCFKRLTALCEGDPDSLKTLKRDVAQKEQALGSMATVLSASNQCCSGKEKEENKCIQEKVLQPMLKFRDLLSQFLYVYRGNFMDTVANISALVGAAGNEIVCCCSNKVDSCVSKFDVPVTNFKANLQECKNQHCSQAHNWFLKRAPEFVVNTNDARLLEEAVIKYYEMLPKYKEHIPKDGKCKNEKELGELAKTLRILKFNLDALLQVQVRLNFRDEQLLAITDTVASELVDCPTKRQLQEYNFQ